MGSGEPSAPPGLISVSRRSDIPRYYARWFAERWREGIAEYRTAFGVPGRVSLRPPDVLGALFWTRDPRPFRSQLRVLQDQGVPAAFQFTINGYTRDLEPHRPGLRGALDAFRAVSEALPGPEAIQWRYDPIVLSDRTPASYHVTRFRQLARELGGVTRVVNVSVVEPYIKAIRRIAEPSTRYRAVDPKRHRSVAEKHPDLPLATDAPALLADLAAVANEYGIELRVCSNPEYSRSGAGPHPASQCIGPELFAPYGAAVLARISALPSAPSRSACRCLRAADIGMDNTCLGGCKYCYVTTSLESAVDNFRRHDPRSRMLR